MHNRASAPPVPGPDRAPAQAMNAQKFPIGAHPGPAGGTPPRRRRLSPDAPGARWRPRPAVAMLWPDAITANEVDT